MGHFKWFTATNAIEISSSARTILTLRPSESSHEKVRRICQQCQPVINVWKKGTVLKTVCYSESTKKINRKSLDRKRLLIWVGPFWELMHTPKCSIATADDRWASNFKWSWVQLTLPPWTSGFQIFFQILAMIMCFNLTKNYRDSSAGWAYLSFIQLQHHVFIQPEGRHCGFRGRIFRAAHLPVKEVHD